MDDPQRQFRELQFIIGKNKCLLNEAETHTFIAITDHIVFV